MSESDGDKSVYQETIEEGAKNRSKKTGESVERIVKQAEADSIKNHNAARGGAQPDVVVDGSEENWGNAFQKVLEKLKRKKK